MSKASSRECKSGYLALFLGYGTSVSVTLLPLVESGGKYKFVAGKGKKINPTSLSKNNNMMQGTGCEMLRDGMPVRLLGATGALGLEPTSAVHTQE